MRRPRRMTMLWRRVLGWTGLWLGLLGTPALQAQDRAFALRATIWDSRTIPVCWENPTEADSQGRQWTRAAVQDTWERVSQVRFVGWQACPPQSRGIRIRIADEGPHVRGAGKLIDGVPAGMVLNFTFRRWSESCAQQLEYCVKALAVHEFGHALSFVHEHNRPEVSVTCQAEPQGPNGDFLVTPYDLYSVMNYCNPQWAGNGKLSALDIVAVQQLYGAPPQEPVVDLAGSVRFVLESGAEMPARRQGGLYVLTTPYPSGTRFRVMVSSPQPTYLYVFGFDRLEKSYRIFPPALDDQATPAAFQNHIIIPDAAHYIQMDETTGTEYMCVVFASQPLPFATILQRLEGLRGALLSRLRMVLESDLVAEEFIRPTETGGIGFTAASRGRTVVPIIVALDHVGGEAPRHTIPPAGR